MDCICFGLLLQVIGLTIKNTSYQDNYYFWDATNTLYNFTHTLNDESNVFYHANKIHDYFKNSPFYYNDMDYRMNAYINQGTDINGKSDGIDIRFGSMGGYFWARSSDVVYHEYTHSTIYHIYGNNWIGIPSYFSEGAAMDEGLSDYFAISINDDPVLGESVGIGGR